MAEGDDSDFCPLCMEELDLTDKTFDSCVCGYQVCLWCWHQIKNEYNGLCPACRTPYSDASKQKKIQVQRCETQNTRSKPRKSKEKQERRSVLSAKPLPSPNRKMLTNVRVMQRNLVYVIGLPQQFADEEILRSQVCFGQYGTIIKAVVNTSNLNSDRQNATASAYITFSNSENAAKCIKLIDGYVLNGSLLRASFGTTKYCNFFLRHAQCTNAGCLYLHELGEQNDSFTKEEMQSALLSGKGTFNDQNIGALAGEVRQGSTFPALRSDVVESDQKCSCARRNRPNVSDERQHAGTGMTTHAQRKAQSAAAISKLKQSNQEIGVARDEAGKKCGRSTTHRRTQSLSKFAALDSVPFPPHVPISTENSPVARDAMSSQNMIAATDRANISEEMRIGSDKPAWHPPLVHTSSLETNHALSANLTSTMIHSLKNTIDFPSSTAEHQNFWKISSDDLSSMSLPTPTLENPITTSPSSLENVSSPSSSFFASIDAIFNPRNQSSEALADLLGVNLSSRPLHHGLVSETNCVTRNSRFAFANQSSLSTLESEGNKSSHATEFKASAPCTSHSDARHDAPQNSFGPSANGERKSNLPCALIENTFENEKLKGQESGIAFLQRMLPNVNISFGGEHECACQTQLNHSGSQSRQVSDFAPQMVHSHESIENRHIWNGPISSHSEIQSQSHGAGVINDPALILLEPNKLESSFSGSSRYKRSNKK